MENNCLTCQFYCAAARLLCYHYCCCCVHKVKKVKQELNIVMLGLENAGKSFMLSTLCGESTTDLQPTNGFSLKDISLDGYVLHVKEIGGSEKVRSYWKHYLDNVDGVVFVIDINDVNDEQKLELIKILLHNIMEEKQIVKKPLLVLMTKCNNSDEKILKDVIEDLDLDEFQSTGLQVDFYLNIEELRRVLEKFASSTNEKVEVILDSNEVNRI